MDMEAVNTQDNTSFAVAQAVPTQTGLKQYIEPDSLKIIRILLEVALGLFGVGGNLLVCIAIGTRKRLKTVANMFVFNLALADLGVLLICLPLVVLHSDFPYSWPFGEIVCKVFFPFTDIFYGVSIGSMVAISFHRYRMIVHCMDTQLTTTKAKILIFIIWMFSYLLFVLPVNLVMDLNHVKGKTFCHPQWPKLIHRQLHVTLVFVFFYFLPLAIISGTYLRIRRKLSADSFLASQMMSRQHSTVKARLDQNRKALQLLTPVVIVFAILMLPINGIRLFASFDPELGVKFPYLRLLYNISVLLLLTNSSINCVIYAIVNKDFRREFKRLLCCGCLKKFYTAIPSQKNHKNRNSESSSPKTKPHLHSVYSTNDPRTIEEMLSTQDTESIVQTSKNGHGEAAAEQIASSSQRHTGQRRQWLRKMLNHSEVRHLVKNAEYPDEVKYNAYDEKLTIFVK